MAAIDKLEDDQSIAATHDFGQPKRDCWKDEHQWHGGDLHQDKGPKSAIDVPQADLRRGDSFQVSRLSLSFRWINIGHGACSSFMAMLTREAKSACGVFRRLK